jgi:leader peptidase (prepilin peptidase)/N-methyltransferase
MTLLALVVVVGAAGLWIGSFLTVVSRRVPAGMAVVGVPSVCPECGTALAARDNLPLLSWVLLRGACRDCRKPIPARYPLIEAVTAAAFLLATLAFLPMITGSTGPRSEVAGGLELLAYLYLAAVSVALAVIDADVRRLPDPIVLPAYGVGVVLLGTVDLLRGDVAAACLAVAGAVLSFLLYLALALVKRGGMGLGDVKLAGVLGLFLGHSGLPALLVGTFAGFFLGGVFGAVLLASRRSTRSTAIPFGPWMLAGAWAGLLFGAPLAAGYLTAIGAA